MTFLLAALIGAAVYTCSRYSFALRTMGFGGEVARLERRSAELGDSARASIGAWTGLAVAAVLIGAYRGAFLLGAGLALLISQVPRWRLAARVAERKRQVRDQFGSAVQAIAESVRAGSIVESAMATVARDAAGFAAEVLLELSRQLGGGLTLEQALPPLRDRVNIDCVTLFATTVLTCRRTGGPMAECLDAVAESVRERQRSERYAEVQTASGRQQLRLLTAFPIAFVLIMFVLFPDGTASLFSGAASSCSWRWRSRLPGRPTRPAHYRTRLGRFLIEKGHDPCNSSSGLQSFCGLRSVSPSLATFFNPLNPATSSRDTIICADPTSCTVTSARGSRASRPAFLTRKPSQSPSSSESLPTRCSGTEPNSWRAPALPAGQAAPQYPPLPRWPSDGPGSQSAPCSRSGIPLTRGAISPIEQPRAWRAFALASRSPRN